MSQFYQGVTAGSLPPSVATQYQTDNGTAVPAANILLVNGKESSENNANGIIVKGGVVGTGTPNEVDVTLTNRMSGSVTTTNATPTEIISPFALGGVDATYAFDITVVAINTTDHKGWSAKTFGTLRTDGTNAFVVGAQDNFEDVDTGMETVGISIIFSGNDFSIEVTGIAAKTIKWSAVVTYVKVSA